MYFTHYIRQSYPSGKNLAGASVAEMINKKQNATMTPVFCSHPSQRKVSPTGSQSEQASRKETPYLGNHGANSPDQPLDSG